ncbi:hypothetical protein Tco_0869943 [Tanacetum coccineum]
MLSLFPVLLEDTLVKFKEEQFSKLIEYVNAVILLNDHLLLAVGAPTRWVSEVPIKINIMAWKLVQCDEHAQIFFSLVSMGPELTTKLSRWWEFDLPDLFRYDDCLNGFTLFAP